MQNNSCVFSRVTRFLLHEEITYNFPIPHAGLSQKINFNYEVRDREQRKVSTGLEHVES